MTFLLRVVVIAIAVWIVTAIIPGISVPGGEPLDYLVVALIFAVVNLLVRPVVTLLSLPFILLTLGLFLFVVNAAMLGLTAALTDRLEVDGFVAALLGALVISAVTWSADNVLGLRR